MKRFKLVIIALLLLLPLHAVAHPGQTDWRGGHTDLSTGVYHYHHGYPAHFHTNGECPYEFKDKTGQNSGTPSSSNSSSFQFPRVTAPPASSDSDKLGFWAIVPIVLVFGFLCWFVFIPFVWFIIGGIIEKIKKRKSASPSQRKSIKPLIFTIITILLFVWCIIYARG